MSLISKLLGRRSNASTTEKNPIITNLANYNPFDIEDKEFIYLESAFQHQEIQVRRTTPGRPLLLEELLSGILENRLGAVCSMISFYRNDMGDEVSSQEYHRTEEIRNFDVLGSVLRNKRDDGHYYETTLADMSLLIQGDKGKVILNLKGLGGNVTVKYFRLSVLIPNRSLEDDLRTLQSNCLPEVFSLVLSFCEDEQDECFERYAEVARRDETRKRGDDLDELDRQWVKGRFEFGGNDCFGYGKWLLEQGRYHDALSQLERMFNWLRNDLYGATEEVVAVYRETCGLIGQCLMKLNRLDEAAYYFNQGGEIYIKFYEECRARLGNLHAYIDALHREETVEVLQSLKQMIMEYRNQTVAQRKAMPLIDDTITLGYAIRELMGIEPRNVRPQILVINNDTYAIEQCIENPEEALQYQLNTANAQNKTFFLGITFAYYMTGDDADKSKLHVSSALAITPHKLKDGLCRVDLMLCNATYDDGKRNTYRVNIPRFKSIILGQSEEKSFGVAIKDWIPCLDYAIGTLKEDFRCLEAVKLLRWSIENLSSFEYGDNEQEQSARKDELYYEASFALGWVLHELTLFPQAMYHNETATYGRKLEHIEEHINCLVNSKDLGAIDAIEWMEQNFPKPENQEYLGRWEFTMAFLKRRKAYVYVEMKRWQEAKQLLIEMMDNPQSRQYAQQELDYVNKMMREQ